MITNTITCLKKRVILVVLAPLGRKYLESRQVVVMSLSVLGLAWGSAKVAKEIYGQPCQNQRTN